MAETQNQCWTNVRWIVCDAAGILRCHEELAGREQLMPVGPATRPNQFPSFLTFLNPPIRNPAFFLPSGKVPLHAVRNLGLQPEVVRLRFPENVFFRFYHLAFIIQFCRLQPPEAVKALAKEVLTARSEVALFPTAKSTVLFD